MSVEYVPLRYVTSVLARGTAPNYVDDGPVRMVSQAANQDSGLDWERTRFHDFVGDPRKLKGYLEFGDSLVNSTGTGTLGRVGWFEKSPDDRPCVADGHVTVTRFDPTRVDKRFGFYYLKSDEFQEFMFETLVNGSTNQIELSRERMSAVSMPVPPLEEQRRIADFLDAETARIDRVVSLRQRQLAVFEERKQAVVDHFLVQEGDPMVHLARLCRVQSGVTVDGGRFSEDSELRPYLRVANVQADGLDLSEVKKILVGPISARRFELRPGDVLMTEGGDLDKLGRGTVWSGEIPGCLHQNHVFAVRPNSRLSGEYLALLTRTSLARSYFEMTGSKTTNLASTSSGKILAFRVPLLELDEQFRRTKEAEKDLSQITAIATAMAKQVDLLSERRQALITAAVTGEFDVSAASGRGIEE